MSVFVTHGSVSVFVAFVLALKVWRKSWIISKRDEIVKEGLKMRMVIIAVFEERKRKNQSESLPRFHHYYASPACLLCVSAEVGTTLEVCISFASPNFCASHIITSASDHELCSNDTANCIHRAIVPLISRLEWFWISWNSNCISWHLFFRALADEVYSYNETTSCLPWGQATIFCINSSFTFTSSIRRLLWEEKSW